MSFQQRILQVIEQNICQNIGNLIIDTLGTKESVLIGEVPSFPKLTNTQAMVFRMVTKCLYFDFHIFNCMWQSPVDIYDSVIQGYYYLPAVGSIHNMMARETTTLVLKRAMDTLIFPAQRKCTYTLYRKNCIPFFRRRDMI